MKYLLALLLLFTLTGCVHYSQLFQTASPNLKKDAKSFLLYENDTLIVKYYFWANEGVLAFSVYNKLDKPIYIDWKKSSYIRNDEKIDYWADEEHFTATTYSYSLSGRSAIYSSLGATVGVAETNGKKVKPERVTFLAPKSVYLKSAFKLYGEKELVLSKQSPIIDVPDQYHAGKTVKAYVATFHKENSPLRFRNFLSISTSEKFEKEQYVDNEFYVSEVREMQTTELLGYFDWQADKYESKYETPDRFFVLFISDPVRYRQK
jgi:hypothetical protein